MKKEKIKWTIKRFPYIISMIKSGQTEKNFYINKKMETIKVDNEVTAILEIMEEVINREKEPWLRKCLQRVRNRDKDISILADVPIEKGKFYLIKERFINKVYDCCIYQRMVDYEEIMKESIG